MPPRTVNRSRPHTSPITIENSGIVPTKMAAMAVPIRGVANDMPISWPATVVAPTTANGSRPALKSSLRFRAAPIAISSDPAMSARNVTAPTQPNAWTTLSSTANETPQTTESIP
jgi:hypothetical protein